MALTNFIFNGKNLREEGFVICSFDGDFDSTTIGSHTTFNTVKVPKSDYSYTTSVEYADNLTTHIQIAKMNCHDNSFESINNEDISNIIYWLNSDENQVLELIDNKLIYQNLIFIGSFNTIDLIKKNGEIVGFDCTFNSPLPYALTKDTIVDINITKDSHDFSITNTSDKNGHTVPKKIEIDIVESGNLTIENKTTGIKTVINNCIKGEKITIDQDILYLTSDDTSHDINNDFNYCFIKLNKTNTDSINEFTVSLPCKIKIYINYIRRVGIL